MHQPALIDDGTLQAIARIWHFGQLIGNADIHDGNLAFQPGLVLAPVYDMLPMLYAPVRGVELSQRFFHPALPLPAERAAWCEAAYAALVFWRRAALDCRISDDFRRICGANAETVQTLLDSPAAGVPDCGEQRPEL